MKRSYTYSPSTRESARLLGQQVRLGRRQRRWTIKDLAARVGVSEVTMRKVERGDLTVALGTAFEAANLVGVQLYEDPTRRSLESRRITETLALMPGAARPKRDVDDNF